MQDISFELTVQPHRPVVSLEEDDLMKDETKCLHAGYNPQNTEPRVVPIVQSTTYVYDSIEDIGAVFDEPMKSVIYSRFANPTVMAVEKKIAELEGGVGALCTSSGQAAIAIAILTLCKTGDSFISPIQIYGGATNLFSYTLKKFGIECIFIDCDADEETIHAAFKPNTKLVFAETLSNPALAVLDIEKFARIAHAHGVPLMVDNTFATPILCKPIEYGADIVLHSTSKYMDGHAVQVGGVIVDSGNFDWSNGNFPEMTEPDVSYHGTSYTRDYGDSAYIVKARIQLMRDYGTYPAAISAFLLNLGLETLPLRMERYCYNAGQVAEYLYNSPKIESVVYPGLPSDKYHDLAKKYLKGASGIVSFIVKGEKQNAIKFMDSLQLASNKVHVADIRTAVLHPATTTHRQLNEEQLLGAGISEGLVRISVGLEHIEDILADLEQALSKI
jgi:O-acetylhomoserine (thiol)-lyase